MHRLYEERYGETDVISNGLKSSELFFKWCGSVKDTQDEMQVKRKEKERVATAR